MTVLKRQSVEYHIHRLKNWSSRFGGFCYDSASSSPTVAIRAMVGATVSISWPSQRDMTQPLDFGGFYYGAASNLLAYRAVPTVVPTIAQIANTRQ
jgi:hypothetical protein